MSNLARLRLSSAFFGAGLILGALVIFALPQPAAASALGTAAKDALSGEVTTEPVKFTPQVSIPGSKFIANRLLTIDKKTITEYISALYVLLVSIAGVLAVAVIVYAGFGWMFAGGSPEKVNKAKQDIVNALVGVFFILFSYALLNTLNPDIVKLNFNAGLPAVDRVEQIYFEQNSESEKGAPTAGLGGCSKPYQPPASYTSQYDSYLSNAAQANNISCTHLKALAVVESTLNPRAIGPETKYGKAHGMIQMLPSTAIAICPDIISNAQDLLDPQKNTACAARYFASLYHNTAPARCSTSSGQSLGRKEYSNDLRYAAAGYNGGPGANCLSVRCTGETFWECTNNDGYTETRCYVEKVEKVVEDLQTKGAGC